MTQIKKLSDEKLFTKNGCNLIFTVKSGSDTTDLLPVSHNEIYDVLKSKGRKWMSKTKKWYLDTDGRGYIDPRIELEIVQKGFEQSI